MIDQSAYSINIDPFAYLHNKIGQQREEIKEDISVIESSLAEIITYIGTEDSMLNRVARGEEYSLEEIGKALSSCNENFQTIKAKRKHAGKLRGRIERNSSDSAAEYERRELTELHKETTGLERIFKTLSHQLSDILGNLIIVNQTQLSGSDYHRVTEAISSPAFNPDEYGELAQILDKASSNVKRLIKEYGLNQLNALEERIQRDNRALSTKHSRYQGDNQRTTRIAEQFRTNISFLSGQIGRVESVEAYLGEGGTSLDKYEEIIGTCAKLVESVDRTLASDSWLPKQESDYYSTFQGLKAKIPILISDLTGVLQLQDDFEKILRTAPESIEYSWNYDEAVKVKEQADGMLKRYPWLENTTSMNIYYNPLCKKMEDYKD